MIIVFGGEKGGTGKSTMAVNQAAWRAGQGREVLLVDADNQRSAQKWAAIRVQDKVQPAIACISLYGETLAEQIRGMMPKYQDIVIDTRGADSDELRAAMLVAHLLITPGKPSQFDLFTMATMDRLVKLAKPFNPQLHARILVNMASTQSWSTEADEMRESCEELQNYKLLNTMVKDRKAYRNCAKDGMGCYELARKDEKAIAEMDSLGWEIWK
jgi:chromosome partitioning protein